MNEGFYLASCRTNSPKSDISFLDEQTARSAEQFHRSFPQYTPTPLVTLDHLAKLFGVEKIYVKGESKPFDLNAFKVLGGSFAIGRYIAQRLDKSIDQLSFAAMTSPEVRAQLGELTFVTATDGNHGRGVAWTANKLGQKSVVYMPRGSAPERLQNIRALGSDASITDLVYDDTVRLARKRAEQPNCVLVQDTSWDGYTEVPSWILQGYLTMGQEIVHALKESGQPMPTHLFLQAGVGSMPAAMAGYFANLCS